MDRRQRYSDTEEHLRAAMDGLMSGTWTAMPGIIRRVSLTAEGMFASVEIAHKAQRITEKGATPIALPELPHCPLWFPRGGGCSLTFPVAVGDECLVVFASRSLDSWWDTGSAQPAVDWRTHDLSDGIALVGLSSRPRSLSAVSSTSVQLRSDDGSTVIDLNPTQQTVTIMAPGGCTISSNLTVAGTIVATGNVTAGNIDLQGHTHTGVQSGSASTGLPQG